MHRVMFLGQKPVGESALRLLIDNQNENLRLCAVCSNPATDVWWDSNAAWQTAGRLNIPRISNRRRNEVELLEVIDKENISLLISVQHSWILSGRVLSAVGGNALNLHLAKLPEYKGYYACNHAILNGDTTFAVTLHWMTENVDEGLIAYQPFFPIAREDTAHSLHEKAMAVGLGAFGEMLACLRAGQPLPSQPMRGTGRFYGRDSLDGLREIKDPSDLAEMDRKARAFYYPPFESAYYIRYGSRYPVVPGGQ